MAVGLVVGVGFEPTPSDFQELLDRGLINATGFDFVTLELSVHEASDRERIRGLYEAACITQGWEAGRLYSPLLTFAEVLVGGVGGKVAIVVRPEGSEDEGWLRGAARDGDTKAMVALGMAAQEDGDRPTAHEWFQQAAADGNGQAMFNLGVDAFEDGDSTMARDWFAQAADTGHPKAMFNLGVFAHQEGDRKAARSWLQRAADSGDEEAQDALAAYPVSPEPKPGGIVAGIGFKPTPGQLQAAASELGIQPGWEYVPHEYSPFEAESDYFLAGDYAATSERRGWRPERKGDLSVHRVTLDGNRYVVIQPSSWYQRAADGGDASAMLQLGVFAYEDGDRVGARSWWQKAASAGNQKAMFNLGHMAEADGDRASARHWYEQAADAGDAQAMASLAFLDEEDGDGASARSWWQKWRRS